MVIAFAFSIEKKKALRFNQTQIFSSNTLEKDLHRLYMTHIRMQYKEMILRKKKKAKKRLTELKHNKMHPQWTYAYWKDVYVQLAMK